MKTCQTCKDEKVNYGKEPCWSCVDFSNWKPKDTKTKKITIWLATGKDLLYDEHEILDYKLSKLFLRITHIDKSHWIYPLDGVMKIWVK